MPPMLLAKARGMRMRRELMPELDAMLTMMGSMRATVPVLLTKPPMADVNTMTKRNSFSSLLPAKLVILPPIFLARPVCSTAPPTMNNPAIIMTTGLEKPDRASLVVRLPVSNRQISAQSAMMSERTRPTAKRTAVTRRMIRVVYILLVF